MEDLSNVRIGANIDEDSAREKESNEVQQTGAPPDGIEEHGLASSIDEPSALLPGRMDAGGREQGEQPRGRLFMVSSPAPTTDTEPPSNKERGPPGTDVTRGTDQVPDDLSDESPQPICELYQAVEEPWRVISEYSKEQWELLRAALRIDSSREFPVPCILSSISHQYRDNNRITWFDDLIEDINSMAVFVNQTSEPAANFPLARRTSQSVPATAEVCG